MHSDRTVELSNKPSLQSTYRVVRSARKTLAIYVYPSGEILVRSPKQCSDKDIHDYVLSREQWIVKILADYSEFPGQLVLRYEAGEGHAYLGELYPIELNTAKRRSIEITNRIFQIKVKASDQSINVKGALLNWYRQQALIVFAQRIEFCFKAFESAGVKKPDLRVRLMKARWGSCSSKGDVTLNLELIKHPLYVIDYVITHELCHLIEFNHSPRFYELMEQAIPQWKKAKTDLEKGVFLYGSF